MRPNEIHPGDLVAGKFRVRSILGRSRGLLLDAFHIEFDQRVVVKLLPAAAADEKEVERFRREARTLAKLESEHVARIIDVGTQPDGSFYLVRQYLEGTDLSTFLRQRGALPLADAVLLILQAAEAVAETHSHNIIIRELKPSDLFLATRPGGAPLIKLIDFGTAKLMRESAAPNVDITATTMFGLSPYSSPELMRKAKHVDVRTDIWSLGAIFYELLTGRPPFTGEPAALMLSISRDEPIPVTQLRPDLPAEVDSIIGWSLAKDVDARFRNVHAFAHALSPYTRGEGEVLVQRIGQTTENAKKRRAQQVPAAAVSSPGRVPPPKSAAGDEDSATQVMSPAAAMGAFASSTGRTQQFPAGTSSQSGFPPPGAPSGFAAPAPPPSFSGSGAQAAGSVPPPGMGPSSGRLDTAQPVASNALSPTEYGKPSNRKVLIGVLAAAAVIVPVLVAVLFLGGKGESTSTQPESNGPIAVPVAAATTAAQAAETAAPPPATAEPGAAATAEPGASAAPEPPTTTAPVAAGGGGKKPVPTTKTPPPPPPPPTPTSAPAPAGGGGKGTLVAVAMGGSCAFSVNGASKGTSSSIRVALSPGRYSVTCKPSSGGAKSKSVVVKNGETAMATFRL
jgi:serine/threonine-protein kinase